MLRLTLLATLLCTLLLACDKAIDCGIEREYNASLDMCVCLPGTVPAEDESCVPEDAGTDAMVPDAGMDACTETTFYRDMDGDDRGDPGDTMAACSAPDGYVDNADDCDDDCNTCWTGATETCDEADNDCDGFTDEGVTEPVGDPVMITAGQAASAQLTTPRVLAPRLSDGGHMLFYQSSATGRFVTRVFDPTTGGIGSESIVDDDADRANIHPDIAVVGDRIGFVAWGTGGAGGFLRGRGYGLDGTPIAAAAEVGRTARWDNDGSYQSPVVRLAPFDGGFAVVWLDVNDDVFFLPLTRNMTSVLGGTPFPLWSHEDGDPEYLEATVTEGGDVFLLLVVASGSAPGLYARPLSFEATEWTRVDDTPGFTSVAGRWDADRLTVALVEEYVTGETDSGRNLRIARYDYDGSLFTRVDSTPIFDEPSASFMPPVFMSHGATTYVLAHRLAATEAPALRIRLSPESVETISLEAGFATPTALTNSGAVYLEGNPLMDNDVAFRRFGCPPAE